MHHLRQDGAGGQDPDLDRSPKQRLADVVFELLTNRSADTGEPITGTVGVKAKASTQLILLAPFGVVDGTDPAAQVEMIGVGPVPRKILETLTPDTELAGMVFDRAGRPLWLGRKQRLANAAQRLAVAIRDGGCFECGAPMHRCELHHIREWHRDSGRTDVDNLVAVCRRHHRWLETNNLIVRRTADGYQTRPRTGHDPPR
jgi:NAD-dependent dihydropyrimidine dehydrogenase PreA subunit